MADSEESVVERVAQSGAVIRRSKSGRLLHASFQQVPNGFDDGVLEDLAGCPRLRELNLSGTSFADRHVERLLSLQRLMQLDLSSTAITDAGACRLKALKQLSLLNLRGTPVTADCIAGLRKQMIRTRILH